MLSTSYPYKIEREGAAYVLQFLDFTEAHSSGNDLAELAHNAVEVLSLTLAGRLEDKAALPKPSKPGAREKDIGWADPEPQIQVALQFRWLLEGDASGNPGDDQRNGASVSDIARALNTSWSSISKMGNPDSNPTVKRLDQLAAAFGKKLVIKFV